MLLRVIKDFSSEYSSLLSGSEFDDKTDTILSYLHVEYKATVSRWLTLAQRLQTGQRGTKSAL